MKLGAYVPGARSNPALLDSFAALVGGMPSLVMDYPNGPTQSYSTFYAKGASAIVDRGAIPILSWQMPKVADILAGKWDDYFGQYALDYDQWGGFAYFRPFYEFNGTWSPWYTAVAADHVAAWRQVRRHFLFMGTSAKFVWCPNRTGRDLTAWYPGADWVDEVGADCYNFGAIYGGWTQPSACYGPTLGAETMSCECYATITSELERVVYRAMLQRA